MLMPVDMLKASDHILLDVLERRVEYHTPVWKRIACAVIANAIRVECTSIVLVMEVCHPFDPDAS